MVRLWRIIEREKIKVRYFDLLKENSTLYGLYLFDYLGGPMIFLDKSLPKYPRLHKCVLAEELGHYYTAPRTSIIQVHTSAYINIIMDQDERKALKWATNFLISDKSLFQAYKMGLHTCYDLAEYFDVTEWFLFRKLSFIRARYGNVLRVPEKIF